MSKKNFPYFSFRANFKNFFIDSAGYWSYPVFVRRPSGEILWMYIVLKTKTNRESNTHYLFRPHALLLTPPNSNYLIKFENFKQGYDLFPKVSWENVLGIFPHSEIQELTVKEFEKWENALLQLCVKETEMFKNKQTISKEFKGMWLKMCNPVFFDFIKCLSPEFHDLICPDQDQIKW
jgi:hypothetical protein